MNQNARLIERDKVFSVDRNGRILWRYTGDVIALSKVRDFLAKLEGTS